MSDQIDVNQLSNALQQKVDLPSGKSQADIDYVIETKAPTSSDPTWYRLYKSGWIEQGGMTTDTTITFSFPMIDTNYFLSLSATNDGGQYYYHAINSYTASGFVINKASSNAKLWWKIEGFVAQS